MGHRYGEWLSRNDSGSAIRQSPTHSTLRAASSSAYAVVWPGPPKDANAWISVATLIASALAATSSSGAPLAFTVTSSTFRPYSS